ncbi:MAG: S-layer homology domain-containing protein [Natronincolaceae bacterium]|nr:S-layer homology domain-containing protein [Bacillota bacterium]NLK90739.1 S-layer homology domain-containing protein [Clostridiales bacterium]
MIKKKQVFNVFITAVIIFTMIFSSISAVVADNLLSDIKGHWAQDTIEDLVNRRIIEGYPDGTFRPNNNITRAEFTSLLVRAFDLKSGLGKVFSDTADHWARDYIKTANYHGLVNGYSDTLFGPDDPVTREQIAAMVVNATKAGSVNESETFTDSAQISAWAKEPVAKAAAAGLITGYPDGSFKPKANATRAEAAVILDRSMKITIDEKTITTFDIAGTYGPEDGIQTIKTDVIINADGVILQNTVIKGNLIISEKVGDGDVTLNNVTVEGTTSIYGGGKDSIHINGGQYNNIIIEGTPGGNVRIVAVDTKGIKIIVSEKAAGEEIILEGTFESVEIKSDDIVLSTQGKTDINKIKVDKNLSDIKLNVDKGTTINELTLDSAAEVKNAEDTIKKIGGDKVSDSGIGNPPKEEREPSSGGGGYTPPVEPDTYTLTLKASPIKGGTVTGSGKYKKGAKIPVTATAAEGYKFINWTTGEEEVSTEAAFTYTMPAEAVTLIANFGEVVVEPGTPVTLEINPMKAKIGDEIALNGNTGPNRLISIKVVDSKGKIVYFDGVKSSGDGKYNTTFKVPDGGDGDLTIVAGYGENVATKVLKIKK